MNTAPATCGPAEFSGTGACPRCHSASFRRRINEYLDGIGGLAAACFSLFSQKRQFMSYSLVWEPDGVLVQFSGNLTAMELIHSTRQVQADSRFDESRYVINDLSAISEHHLSDEALRELSAINYGAYASQPNCRIIYVTTDAALAAQLLAILMAPEMASYEVATWPTVTEARDWLDSQPQLHQMSNIMGFRIR
jgi:hypothetical protein